MNVDGIIAAFIVIDTVLERLEHRHHTLAQVSDTNTLPWWLWLQGSLRAIIDGPCVLYASDYLSDILRVSRFNCRLHALADWLAFLTTAVGEVCTQGDVFVMDSCPYVDGSVRGRAYSGYRAVKYEKCFGWRRHLLCTPADFPASFTIAEPGALALHGASAFVPAMP